MSQQINLLDSQLVKPKVWLSAVALLVLIGVVAAGMLTYAAWAEQRLLRLEGEQQAVGAQLAAVRVQLDQAMQARAPRAPSKALEEELARAEAMLTHQQEILAFLEGEGVGRKEGYFAYLQAFARKRVPGLWLTGFTLEAGSGRLTIEGKAMQPELVPQYIALLGEEPLLSGRQFSSLQMESQKPVTDKGDVAAPVAGTVDFKLLAMELPMASGASSAEVRP